MTIYDQRQLRHVFSVTSGATPKSNNKEYWGGDIHWVTPKDISSLDGYWLKETQRKITLAGYENCGATLAPIKSIVLSKRAPIGQLAILANEVCSNQGCFLLSPLHEADTRFFYYWLSAKSELLQALGRGSTFMELSTDDLKSLRIPHPSISEQHAIANHLDCETARLDDLISVKERLLELLAEKRRALITSAVTRGLDPDVTLRDSGIPWIGEIPVHWNIEKLKYLATLKSGETITSESITETGDYPVFGGNGLRGFESSFTHEGYYVLIGRQGALCGNVHIVSGRFWASEHAIVVSMKKEDEVFWLGELLRAMNLNQYSESAAQPGLAVDFIANLQLPVPSLIDQRSISTHIKTKMVKMDKLKEITKRTIVMLKERRAALIADAVTGKIKVV